MRPISEKRAGEQPARREVVRQALERDGYRCQFWEHCDRAGVWTPFGPVPPLPCSATLDVHEVIPRSVWAKGHLELSNTVTLCRAHHDWVGDHPAAAHKLGLHGFSHERPDALARSQVAEDAS